MPRPRKKDIENNALLQEPFIVPDRILAGIDDNQPRAQQMYSLIRSLIIEMELNPGSPISEKAIGEAMSVSRTPLREALLKLADEGFVTIVPNMGTFVSKIDLATVFEGQFVRRALELETTRVAALKMDAEFLRELDVNMYQQQRCASDMDEAAFYQADEEFHRIISSIAASKRVWKTIHVAKGQLDRVRRLAFPLPDHMKVVLEEHTAIYEGLKNNDPAAAVAAMEIHLARIFITLQTLCESRPELFSEDAADMIAEHAKLLSP